MSCARVVMTSQMQDISAAGLEAAEDEGALDFLDGLGDLDAPRAGFGAVEGGPAAPDAFAIVEDLEAFLGAGGAAVEDEPVRAQVGGRPGGGNLGPVDRTRRGAGRAQDAFGRVVETFPVLLRLN